MIPNETNNIQALVSVIVPVYNVEKHLHKCVDSILQQSYKNIEIILVDDGSPDSCPQICDDYTHVDDRVKVIHKQNGGLADARNAGIEIAGGEYISFLDSDDYIAPNMIEHLMNKIDLYDADISFCSLLRVREDTNVNAIFQPAENDITFSGAEAIEWSFTHPIPESISACAKLYRLKLFKGTGIRFPVGRISEDVFIMHEIFFSAQRVVYSNQQLYFYLVRYGSISNKGFYKQQLDMIEACLQAIDFVKDNNLPFTQQAYAKLLWSYIGIMDTILRDVNWRQWITTIKEMRRDIFTAVPKPLSNRYLPKRQIINLFVLKIGIWSYIPSYRLWLFIKKYIRRASRQEDIS